MRHAVETMESPKLRRPGYAPENEAVGRRGLRTRSTIIARAAELFAEEGFHGTSIDAIAKAAGASRATVYQYFHSKDDLLAELVDECRPALMEHARCFSGLGPSQQGLRSLRTWLTDLAALYERYTVVFVEFPGIGLHQGPPAALAGGLGDAYLDVIATELRRAGVEGLEPRDMASVLLRLAHMVNLYRSRNMFGLRSKGVTTSSLSVAMQRLLFPAWQPERQTSASATSGADCAAVVAAPPRPVVTPAANASPARLDVLAAAAALFAEHGYHGVSMEDIATAAQVGRTTLYRYFSTKVAVLAELTDWAVLEGGELWTDLHHLAVTGADPRGLRGWLSRYVHYHRSYGAVIRAWYDGTVAEQLPEDIVSQGLGGFHGAVHALLTSVELPPGVEIEVADAIFLAALGRLSEMTVSLHPEYSDYEGASLIYTVVHRALLSASPTFSEPSR